MVAALVPVAAVSAAVALNVNRMVISSHDSTVVSSALGFSTTLAVALSFVLGRRVASGSRELTRAFRGLAEDTYAGSSTAISMAMSPTSGTPAPACSGNGRSSAPAEIAALAPELETTRASLRLSREHERSLEQRRGPLSMVELAYDVVGEAREHARRRHIDLVLDVADDADRLAVQGKDDDFARALSNLVGNAVRHTQEHGQVLVSARRAPDGRAQLAVTDGRGGIRDDDLPHVFEIGWRGEPDRGTRDAGAGSGHAVARGMIESHAASISVANVEGGCRFDAELPRHPEPKVRLDTPSVRETVALQPSSVGMR